MVGGPWSGRRLIRREEVQVFQAVLTRISSRTIMIIENWKLLQKRSKGEGSRGRTKTEKEGTNSVTRPYQGRRREAQTRAEHGACLPKDGCVTSGIMCIREGIGE